MSERQVYAITGPEAGGKTLFAQLLRSPEYKDSVFLPCRYVTFVPDLTDEPLERVLKTEENFKSMVKAGNIIAPWVKVAPDIASEPTYFGFEPFAHILDKHVFLTANNSFTDDNNIRTVRPTLDNATILMVNASREMREQRLSQRYLDPRDVKAILELNQHGDDFVRTGDRPMEVLDTSYCDTPEKGLEKMRRFIKETLGIEAAPQTEHLDLKASVRGDSGSNIA